MAGTPRHYLLRTSWLIGAGENFVRTMRRLAAQGVSPAVVDDQVGRLTFVDELVRATTHLLDTDAAFGAYHLSNTGDPMSWAQVAQHVFRLSGRDPGDVRPVSTQEYAAGRPLAPRPGNSLLSTAKIQATGFTPGAALAALTDYCSETEPAAEACRP